MKKGNIFSFSVVRFHFLMIVFFDTYHVVFISKLVLYACVYCDVLDFEKL